MRKRANFTPKCLPTGIGSLPHTEAKEACEVVLRMLPEIPFWPQLARRSPRENMYWQYSENLPGVTFEEGRLFIRASEDFSAIEKFYEDFLSARVDIFSIGESYAAGFYQFLEYEEQLRKAWALKGQITGPISFTLQVTDEKRRPLLYHEELRDVATKNLLRKANWQEGMLKECNERVIIFLDEPYLSAFGSAFTSLSRQQVMDSLEEVLQGIQAFTGVHCCGNTDWSILLDLPIDILSFDAYSYASNLLLYRPQLKKYLNEGGTIAWGMVPTSEEALEVVSAETLLPKLEEVWKDLLKDRAFDLEQLLSASLITPSCGLGTVSQEMAVKALKLTGDLSRLVREKYKLAA